MGGAPTDLRGAARFQGIFAKDRSLMSLAHLMHSHAYGMAIGEESEAEASSLVISITQIMRCPVLGTEQPSQLSVVIQGRAGCPRR